MPTLSRRTRRTTDIWPGFVDALSSLLMVVIFLLMVFVLAQFFLSETLSGREEALRKLQTRVAELADLLALERSANTDLRFNVQQLSDELQASVRAREDLQGQVDVLSREEKADKERLTQLLMELDSLEALRDELRQEVSALADKLQTTEENLLRSREDLEEAKEELERSRIRLASEEEVSEEAKAQVALLNRQIRALREQMAELSKALELEEQKVEEQEAQIASLGKRLNAALATKVQELARYRSEFFGRLREVLGNRRDIRIVGDRFVFQSEVLFSQGSAELGFEGRERIAQLADTLREIMARIPDDIDWIMRVDGHTDRVPIRTSRFASNWELSAARAIEVVKVLIDQGIPPSRLVAAGFGEYQPLDARDDEIAFRRNRRIEFKLTQR